MPGEIQVENKPLDIIMVNGKWYLLADTDLRKLVSGWSASDSLDPSNPNYNPNGFVSASEIVLKLNEKIDAGIYNQLYSLLLDKRIAMTASYNDLVDVPSFGGARVDNHTLIFTGSSSGQEAYLLDQIDQISNVIGTGVLSDA